MCKPLTDEELTACFVQYLAEAKEQNPKITHAEAMRYAGRKLVLTDTQRLAKADQREQESVVEEINGCIEQLNRYLRVIAKVATEAKVSQENE